MKLNTLCRQTRQVTEAVAPTVFSMAAGAGAYAGTRSILAGRAARMAAASLPAGVTLPAGWVPPVVAGVATALVVHGVSAALGTDHEGEVSSRMRQLAGQLEGIKGIKDEEAKAQALANFVAGIPVSKEVRKELSSVEAVEKLFKAAA
jgi:hypothetical protein